MTRNVLTTDERALVDMHRAFRAYVFERMRLDPTLDEPRAEEHTLELHPDTSGRIVVEPDDPNENRFSVASWHMLQEAPAAVEAARADLETARRAREGAAPARKTGDPRKGRRAGAPTRGWWTASALEHAAARAEGAPACTCPACKVARAVG
jgi:hypothetical protein